MEQRILVVLGHPRNDSLCGTMAEAYAGAATDAGAQVRRINIGALDFDPLAVTGESNTPAVETDILSAQRDIHWARHLVFIYPIWWGTMPALLKGFIERAFATGFAIDFPERPPYYTPLLRGRSARLITTMNTPPFIYRWLLRAPGHNVMKRAILRPCGIKPVGVTAFGPVRGAPPERRNDWIARVSALGQDCS